MRSPWNRDNYCTVSTFYSIDLIQDLSVIFGLKMCSVSPRDQVWETVGVLGRGVDNENNSQTVQVSGCSISNPYGITR